MVTRIKIFRFKLVFLFVDFDCDFMFFVCVFSALLYFCVCILVLSCLFYFVLYFTLCFAIPVYLALAFTGCDFPDLICLSLSGVCYYFDVLITC